MHCSSCGFDNREEAKFCNECGASLALRCSSCGAENQPGAKFCNECGTTLTKGEPENRRIGKPEKVSPGSKVRSPGSRQDIAERRQLTVMFCDLVGSTALSTQLDPEELREVEREYQRLCAAVISRFEGHLAKYIGDGLLVYFGYPVAHEDDARRAVHAGLGIVEAIGGQGSGVGGQERWQHLNAQLPQPLQVRIGIHTGLVVAGEMGTADQPERLAIVGETPNIAARLQEKAAPNSVLISAATYRLIEGYFTCSDLGFADMKGLPVPVQVYQVVGESGVHSRLEVAATAGLTPLVGREEEIALLRRYWTRAKEGEGQVVLLSGEPGIGKSRLAQVLREHVSHEGATWLEFHCSPYYQHTAWYPIIEHLQRVLQFDREDTPQTKLAKLQSTLAQYRFPQADTVPLLAALLSLPHPEGSPPLTSSPQKQKQRTQEALIAWIVEEAERNAVHSTWEDLHWADPSTLEVLQLYINQVPTTRMLALLTFRPEFHPPWAMRSHLSQITLSRLGRKQVEEIVEKMAGGKGLPTEVVQQIVAKTDGIPLFIEELTKTVVESVGATPASPVSLAIPTTLHDSLMARLDRLGNAKAVAQLGATLGREFSYELLQAVSPLNEETLQKELTQLVEAELVYQRGLPPQTRYIFKHALVQDTAYQSLLKSTRQQYHQQIAQVLDERFTEIKETQPELLAHHYTEAGLITQAIPYWQRAGQRASQRSANVEAIAHLTKGLELLKTLPDSPERAQQELALQTTLGPVLIATKGYTAPEVEHAYTRALELCRRIGETPQLFPVLRGLQAFHFIRAEYKTSRELAEQLLTLAQRVQDPALLLGAHFALGETLYFLGELTSAREHLEEGLAFYDPQQDRSLVWAGSHPAVQCLSFGASALWLLGYPDQALKKSHKAIALAQELSHLFSLALALTWAASLHRFRREGQAVREQAEAAITLSTEHGFLVFLEGGKFFRSWALAEQGQAEEGIAQMRWGLAASRSVGAEVYRPRFLAMLAQAYEKVGRTEEGLAALAEALSVVDETGERVDEAELYRLKGELTLQLETRGWRLETSPPSPQASSLKPQVSRAVAQEAEGYFLKAIEIARRQQAKSWELRAVMSLARLWKNQGKKEEARQMLAEIYGWFTEGFDTADLKEAKALLEELAGD